MNIPLAQPLKRFFKQTFLIGLVFSLTVYAWLRVIFFEVPFSISEDGTILIKTVLSGWSMIIVLKATWLFIVFVGEKIDSLKGKKFTRRRTVNPLVTAGTISDTAIMPL